MTDDFRTSDADRDGVAALLRDHFAAGRLTRDELDERLTAALNARTFGDLRRVLADLPGPAPVPLRADRLPLRADRLPPRADRLPPRADRLPPRVAPGWISSRRRPRLLPLAVLALVAALLIPGVGWLLLAFFQAVLLLWLAASLAGIFVAARFYRRMRRDWWAGQRRYQSGAWPGGYPYHHYG
jgi:Domain of unknown function (DUF1707)